MEGKYQVFVSHYYFSYSSNLPVVEVKLPIIPRIGEFFDPWQFLTTDQEQSILKHITGEAYMASTYVRAIKHEFEEIQRIYLYLDNTTFKNRNHSVESVI